ncbi:MAG: PAS domain S-box protein, partial [Dehalococcoidia bacterium]|nr:PAS domain S-box protein [Dehalococcoidia bacterium]
MVENQDSDGRCIRVLLVHDADREPEGMPRLLDEVTVPEIEVTRAADLAEAGQCLASGQQDIVLLQLDCVGTDADLAGAIGSMNEAASGIAIILFGRPEQERAGAAALSSGAADFLVTDTLNSTALGRVLRYAVVRASLEARLRESERKYRKLFEHSGVAMVLVDGDSIRMVNQRAAELLSLPPEAQVEGMAFTSLLLQDEAARVMDLMKSADARTPLAFETRVLPRCGDIRMMELNVVATSDSNTRIVSLLDLTDRLLAEAEIRRQREYFRALFENSPEGIIAVDGLGRIEDANPSFERLFGFKRGEL